MELNFNNNSDNVVVSSVEEVEVSVHQELVGVSSNHLGFGTGPNHEYYSSNAAMRRSVNGSLNQSVLVPQAAYQRSFPLKKGFPRGIKVTSMVTTKTVKPPPTSPSVVQDKTGQAQEFKAMMQDIIKSSLNELGVIPKADPHSHNHSLL